MDCTPWDISTILVVKEGKRSGGAGFDRGSRPSLALLELIAERGFDPRTFGLWAQHASHCATPLGANDFMCILGHLCVAQAW